MAYITTEEAAVRWGITRRRVRTLCQDQRVEGAIRLGWEWAIPENAPKPKDKRYRPNMPESERSPASYERPTAKEAVIGASFIPTIQGSEEADVSGTVHVSDLLEMKYFSAWRVVGGAKGLSAPITTLNLMESPDIANWSKPHQFIVTTGYCIRDDVNVQKQVMRDLNAKGCAGIGIKILRFFRTIPQHMIDLADEFSMPLIEIPGDYNISEIMNEIMKEVFVRQLRHTENSYRLYREFAQIGFRVNALNELCAKVGELLLASAAITDSNWSTLGLYDNDQLPVALASLMEQDTSALPFTAGIPPFTCALALQGFRLFRTICPIFQEDQLYGYLTIWAEQNPRRDAAQLIIQHATEIAGFMMRQRRAQIDDTRQQRERLLEDLLTDRIKSEAILAKRGAPLGIAPDAPFQCVVLHAGPAFLAQRPEELMQLSQRLAEAAAALDITATPIMAENGLVLVLAAEPKAHKAVEKGPAETPPEAIVLESSHSEATALLERLHEKAEALYGKELLFGVGSIVEARNLHMSYAQAEEVLSLCLEYNLWGKSIVLYDEIQTEALLMTISTSNKALLLQEITEKLIDHDARYGMDLIPTLQAYFSCQLNSSQAAKQLFVHRNTLLYRLERAKEVLQMNFENYDDLLRLQIALKLHKYQKIN